MKPRACKTCGKREWGHVCLGERSDDPKPEPALTAPVNNTSATEVTEEALFLSAKAGYNAHMREYMRKWRAKQKAKRTEP